MNRVIKPALILLALFFSFSVLSELPFGYQTLPSYTKKYVFHFYPPTDELQLYEILSVHQTRNYLLFDVDKMKPSDMEHRDKKKCFFKRVVPPGNLERIDKHSKVVFSIQEIDNQSLTESGDPVIPLPAPLPYHGGPGDPVVPLPAPLPYHGGPGDPVVPLPAPLPYHGGPGDPVVPLPAPLPYHGGPGDPVVPLPAPLPYHGGPGDPVVPLPAPLPYHGGPGDPVVPLPAPLPYHGGPGDPVVPLPAPLPYHGGPGDPVVPLPAPLPYYEGPGDPVVPLPAPLPYYIDSVTGEYVILHKDHKGIIQNVIFLTPKREKEWSDDVADVWKEYFHHFAETCDN